MSWLTGWNRRKSKIINGSTAGAQTGYQMRLVLYKSTGTDTSTDIYLGTNVNNNFSDIRFTSSDEITLLNYWIESYVSGSYAIVWIKIDSIPISPSTKTIYLYYDNPAATSISSGDNTFIFFDDFQAGFGKWTNNDPTNIYISGGQLIINSVSDGKIAYVPIPSTIDFILNFDIRANGFERYHATRVLLQNSTTIIDGGSPPSVYTGFQDYGGDYGRISSPLFNGLSSLQQTSDLAVSQYTWYHVKITKYQSTANIRYWTFVQTEPSGTNFLAANAAVNYIAIATRRNTGHGETASSAIIDDIRIRKYISPEPTFGPSGIEETIPICTPCTPNLIVLLQKLSNQPPGYLDIYDISKFIDNCTQIYKYSNFKNNKIIYEHYIQPSHTNG